MLALMTAGGIAENDAGKMLRWGAASVACFAAILLFTKAPKYSNVYAECRIEWDGRNNPEVCD